MVDSDDDEVLFSVAHSKQQARGLLGNEVKNINDVMNGPKEDRRLKKTLALCAAFLGLGLAIAVLGPTLPALQRHLGTQTDQMFYAFVGRSIGYLCGSVVGGAMFDWFQPSLLMAVMLLGAGVGLVAAPFCSHLWSLAVILSTVGLAMGGLDTGANIVCLRLWGKRSSPFLQALHFCFAVGAFISPLMAKPFLHSMNSPTTNLSVPSAMTNSVTMAMIPNQGHLEVTKDVDNADIKGAAPTNKTQFAPLMGTRAAVTNGSNTAIMNGTDASQLVNGTDSGSSSELFQDASTTEIEITLVNETHALANGTQSTPMIGTQAAVTDESYTAIMDGTDASQLVNKTDSGSSSERFQNVYIIVGICNILVSVSFFYFFCTSPIKPPPSQMSEINHGSSKNKDFKNYVMLLMFLFYFLYVGAEIGFGGYIATFATNVKYDESKASLLNAAFWGAFATGRGLSICLAGVLLPHVMLVLDMGGCILSSMALSLYGDSSDGVLWIGTMILGLSMASLFPAGISWLESYYKVTGRMASILIIGSALGEMVFPMIISQSFHEDDSFLNSFQKFLNFGPRGLMYIMLASSGFTAILFAIMQYLAKQNGVEQLLPTEVPNPAKDISVGVQESFSLEDLSLSGKPKQSSAVNTPKILRVKKHKE